METVDKGGINELEQIKNKEENNDIQEIINEISNKGDLSPRYTEKLSSRRKKSKKNKKK